jgi:hypothetical protein
MEKSGLRLYHKPRVVAHTCDFPTLRRLRQEKYNFQDSWGYHSKSLSPNKTKQTTTKTRKTRLHIDFKSSEQMA